MILNHVYMNESEISLGQALAYLQAMNSNESHKASKSLSDSAKKYINDLNRFRSDPHNEELIKDIFSKIPEHTCRSDKSYLSNNFQFFIALLVIQSEHYSCERLIKHLNSCYSCFDVFCQVFRDYFHTSNNIIIKTEV
jgi:hypothetical protein